MTMNAQEYNERFEKVYALLVDAHAAFFVWRGLQNKDYEQYWKSTSNFWSTAILSLEKSWLQSLANIYELSRYSEKDSVISIYSLIKHQPSEERRKKAEALLENNKDVISNISRIRDHRLSHNNAKHLLSPKELFEKFPVKFSEVEALLGITEELFHLLHPEDNRGLSMKSFNEKCVKDAELVMKKMRYYDSERKKYLEKVGRQEIPYSEFPPN